MPDPWSLATIVLLVVGVVVAALVAFRFSERAQNARETTPGSTDGLDPDLVSVLAALSATSIVLGPDDEVLRAAPAAHSLGLLRGGRLAHPALAQLAVEARTEGGSREVAMTLPRGPAVGSGRLLLQVRVAALREGRVLLLVEDRTAQQRLDEVRRDFVANVSHELKTPVGAIALLTETIMTAAEEPEAVRRFATRMAAESRRLTGLVQDIIDLSRIQEPDALLDSDQVEVDAVVCEAADRTQVEALARDIAITTGGTRDLRVFGDRGLLVTAVRNLLDNAVRYSEGGTRVSVGVSLAADDMVEIAVVDQGVGIDQEFLPRVFERFYRIDPARSRATGGTGLGLSIVKHVAADHGGEVRVWSVPGRGSTFTLRVPVVDAPTDVPDDVAPGSAPACLTPSDATHPDGTPEESPRDAGYSPNEEATP